MTIPWHRAKNSCRRVMIMHSPEEAIQAMDIEILDDQLLTETETLFAGPAVGPVKREPKKKRKPAKAKAKAKPKKTEAPKAKRTAPKKTAKKTAKPAKSPAKKTAKTRARKDSGTRRTNGKGIEFHVMSVHIPLTLLAKLDRKVAALVKSGKKSSRSQFAIQAISSKL